MSLLKDIKKKAQTFVQQTTRNVPTSISDIKKLEKQVTGNIQKAANNLKTNLQKVGGGASLGELAMYGSVYPYFFVMKSMLDKKGVKYNNNIIDVTKKFYSNVVASGSNYEANFGGSFYGGVDAPIYYNAVPVYSYNDGAYNVDAENYDSMAYNVDGDTRAQKLSGIGATIGGVLGTAAGTAIGAGATAGTAGAGAPAIPGAAVAGGAIGTAAGAGAETIIKKVVNWFFALLKAKKEGKLTDPNLLAAGDAAANALSGMTPEEAAAANAVSSSGFGGLSMTWIIVIAVVVVGGAVLLLRKK